MRKQLLGKLPIVRQLDQMWGVGPRPWRQRQCRGRRKGPPLHHSPDQTQAGVWEWSTPCSWSTPAPTGTSPANLAPALHLVQGWNDEQNERYRNVDSHFLPEELGLLLFTAMHSDITAEGVGWAEWTPESRIWGARNCYSWVDWTTGVDEVTVFVV